jgi:hypothetical protein
MNAAYADDCRIETRFVWARCAAENVRAMQALIKAFQNDNWDGTRQAAPRKKHARRSSHR